MPNLFPPPILLRLGAPMLMAASLLISPGWAAEEDYTETFGGDIPVGMVVETERQPEQPAARPTAAPGTVVIGNLISHTATATEVMLEAEGGRVRIVPRAPGIVRIDLIPAGIGTAPHSWAVTRTDWPAPAIAVEQGEDDALRVRSDGWMVEVSRTPMRLKFHDGEGDLRLQQPADEPMRWLGETRSLAFELATGEAIYGLGNQSQEPLEVKLDRRGHSFRIQNRHPSMTLLFPFWISSQGTGVFIDNPGFATLDVGATTSDRIEYQSEAGELSFYVFLGSSMIDVLDQYTQVTGRPALAPRWTLGNLQSRFGYNSFASLQSIIDGFATRAIPLDCVILDLDWFGGDRMGNLEFRQTAEWPNPVESLAAIRRQGIKLIPITEPQVTAMSFNAPEVLAQGLVAREKDNQMVYGLRMWITSRAPVYLLDFTREETREWWAVKHRKLIQDYAFDGFWQDLNEPEGLRDDMRFAAGSAAAVGNVIALLMNRSVADAVERYRPGFRPFIMSRSGYAGMQKYGAGVWSGDVQARWVDLSRQPALGLSTGMAGIPYWNSDIGGYAGDTTPELYLRWCQFAFFNPIYRPHAAFKEREPWAFGAEVESAARALLLLRYRLLPYYYNVSRMAYDTGTPMMRPLILHWPGDPALRDLDDQFLYGPSLMAAPILTEGATSRDIILPTGIWYDWYTGQRHHGPVTITKPAPLSEFPLFVLAPAIIPMGPEVLRTDARPLDIVTLQVYLPPMADEVAGHLYEDDGLTLGYQRGESAITRFSATRPGGGRIVFNVDAIEGTFPGMVESRSWEVRFHDTGRPRTVTMGNRELPDSPGAEAWQYDAEHRVLTVTTSAVATTQKWGFEVEVAP